MYPRTEPRPGAVRSLALAALLLALASIAGAATAPSTDAEPEPPIEVSGAKFERSMRWEGTPLHLVGAGLLRYRILFKGYSAALYLPGDVSGANWNDDVAKCLELYYYWDIDADLFGPAGREVLARSFSAEELAPLAERLDQMDASYVDIEEGDRYALCYAPGSGTTLVHNDRPVATIAGADFARVYYNIWLGPEPVDAGLRDALTGGGR